MIVKFEDDGIEDSVAVINVNEIDGVSIDESVISLNCKNGKILMIDYGDGQRAKEIFDELMKVNFNEIDRVVIE